MNKNIAIQQILEKVITLSPSFYASPFVVTSFKIDSDLRTAIGSVADGLNDIISISIREDYTSNDLEEYFLLSKECLSIESHLLREIFVQKKIEQIHNEYAIKNWIDNQCYIALGIIIYVSKSMGYDIKTIDLSSFDNPFINFPPIPSGQKPRILVLI